MDTLVMIPGLGSDGAVWRRTIAALGGAAAGVVGDTLQDDSLKGMAQRVLSQAPERFWLAGVSMGGMVALEILRGAPERVRGLALVDTNAKPDTEAQAAYRRQVNGVVAASDDFRKLVEGSLGTLVHASAPADVRQELVEMSLRVGATTYVRQNEAVARRDDQRPVLPGIAVPTLVIVGAEDLMTPPAVSREIAAAIPGAELHEIAGCGHLPPIEAPQVTADLLRGLMARGAPSE